MGEVLLFPLAEYWWFYAAFALFVLAVLALDLGVFHREAHVVSVREAAVWSCIWVGLAVLFNVLFYFYLRETLPGRPELAGHDTGALASEAALEFTAGYLVEKALAIDNIFVFVAVFSYFAIPPQYQHKVLFYGILGALVFRALFISLGAVLIQYHVVVLVFGALLILTGIKILALPERPLEPERNPVLRLLRRWLPLTPGLHGERFWVKQDGRLFVTPLFAALLFIEFSDIIFAVDSVPAIFALTDEPLIVYTSNMFAILGLRSMFFLLANAFEKFYFLKYGLGVILVFVGLKMVWLNEAFDGKFPIAWSLSIIAAILAISIVVSIGYERSRRPPAAAAAPIRPRRATG
jgi:tellurite resistance protein TerC